MYSRAQSLHTAVIGALRRTVARIDPSVRRSSTAPLTVVATPSMSSGALSTRKLRRLPIGSCMSCETLNCTIGLHTYNGEKDAANG